MTDGHHTNAMTEIALALAMAFFSIMVLTMVSMGAGFQDTPKQDIGTKARLSVAAQASPAATDQRDKTAKLVERETLIIHFQGRFLDSNLKAIDPAAMSADRPLVLAVDPGLAMAETIALRASLAHADITVTTLNEIWLNRLKESRK